MKQASTQYTPQDHESRIYHAWEQAGIFQPKTNPDRPPFVIMLPPPNITGSLHMGHALQDTIMDILIRYHRMLGDETVWVPGTDHAALGTNKVIENQLHDEGKTRHDIGREAFLKRTNEWYEKTGNLIISQMKRLGCSCDWTRQRFTMDEDYIKAVETAFIRYFEKGYIYRGARLVNWDPKTQTTVSDLEVEWQTEKAPLYTLQYGPFQIATARPETKFGDKYVVMHPDDERYAAYTHGQTLTLEWINGPITATVIKEKSVDPAFGTGVMTITPWHDAVDFDIAQRNKLDMEQIIDFEGKLLPIAGEFSGMPIHKARPLIVEKLQEKGLLVSVDESYSHNIAVNERGKGQIEPQVMRQWFVDMSRLNDETIEVAKKDIVQFLPERWKKHFITWMENVRDWNINRQIWLGHRLPVWWKKGTHGTAQEEGNFVVATQKPEGEWEQDPDVLDTWFSSALWPFATLGWPNNTPDLERFYPTSVLVTGRDIIYLWVARMIFSGLTLMEGNQEQRIPFHDVFIYPTMLTKQGQRMSKSLGTGIDPLEMIEKYGADATRFGLMYQMTYDQQAMKFDETAVEAARNFGNKIWNISRLLSSLPAREDVSVADQWIEYRFNEVSTQVTQLLQEYKIGEAARVLYSFIWKDFADWYVEIIKHVGSTTVAVKVFQQTLHVLHPFMPHLTEVLWQEHHDGFIATESWPEKKAPVSDTQCLEQIAYFQSIITAIRSARMLLGIKQSEVLEVIVPDALPTLSSVLETMARVTLVTTTTHRAVTFALGDGNTVQIASSAITTDSLSAAREKLTKELEKTQKLIATQQKSLEQMKDKAPADKVAEKEQLIAKEQARTQDLTKSLQLLAG